MRWDRFFEDLEDQLASEWEAERAALDTEAERLRLSRVTLRDRLLVARDLAGRVSVDLRDRTTVAGIVVAIGADWLALSMDAGAVALIPTVSVEAIGMGDGDLLRTARADASSASGLAERMGMGFVLRNLARRRSPVTLHVGERALSGTIDRAGADHLDLAVHDPGMPRRSGDVRGMRLVPLAAVVWIRLDAADQVL